MLFDPELDGQLQVCTWGCLWQGDSSPLMSSYFCPYTPILYFSCQMLTHSAVHKL